MQTVRTVLISFSILAGILPAVMGSALAQQYKKPECKCQNYGRYIKAGDTACIRTNKGPKMARCVMRGNVTDWDFLDEDCAHTSMSTIPVPAMEKIENASVIR